MIELEGLPPLNQPVLVAAFEGWNDAAEAATGLIDHILGEFPGQRFADVDPEDYYDFQVNRPIISVGERGVREITWPATSAYARRLSREAPTWSSSAGSSQACGGAPSSARSSVWPSSSMSTASSPSGACLPTRRTPDRYR